MLGLMGLDELVASDADAYVAIAARLAGDADWRHELSRRIVAAQPAVFDDAGPLLALEQALVALAES
jgi:predicted O-linked N-acetylglucosamine transferase (SPINDLY family)